MTAWIFWLSIALIGYAYLGYPIAIRIFSRALGKAPQRTDSTPPVTIVIAACNEAARIGARIENILAQDYPAENLSIIVVSDGSTDSTAQVASRCARTHVIALAQNGGKAAAVNTAMALVETQFVIFTDVRQRFAADALRRLLSAFADPTVGAVTGELQFMQTTDDIVRPANIGLYWRMEKSLRADEAMLGWLHGVSGAVYAMRREWFRPIPPGTLLDDMWVPLQVIFAGQRVWMARDAIAYDTLSSKGSEEFHRKLRTLAGNWQLIFRLPRLLDPLRNRVFFAWFSHKFLRLIVPWALIAAWLAAARTDGTIYRLAWLLQSVAYLGAIFALAWPRIAARIPLLPAAGTFLMLNAAALLALPAWLILDQHALWKKH